MSKKIGQDIEVGIAKETTRGTAVDPASGYWIKWGELTLNNLQENNTIEVNLGHIFTEGKRQKTKVGYEIEIKMPLEDIIAGHILMGMFGSVSTTSDNPETGVNTHDFTINDSSETPTYTISMIDGTNQYQFTNAVLTEVTLSAPARDKMELTVKYRTKMYSTTSGLTSSYSDNHLFSSCNMNYYEANDYSGLGSAMATSVRSVELSFSRDLKELETVGSCEVDDLLALNWTAQVNIEKDWDTSDSDMSDSENLTSKAFKVELVGADTIGGSSHPTIKFAIPSGVKTDFNRDIALKEVIGSKFGIHPDAQDLTNGYMLAQLINTESGY